MNKDILSRILKLHIANLRNLPVNSLQVCEKI